MVKKKVEVSSGASESLKHHPFAALASHAAAKGAAVTPARPQPVVPPRPAQPLPPLRVRLRIESKGRSGKVVTRVTGLPAENIEVIAGALRKALGCGAVVEEADLLLLGSLVERATEWLDRAGDLRAITEAQPKPAPALPPRELFERQERPPGDDRAGTQRSAIRPGGRVAIVQKADQDSGRLTEGIVRELLTPSPNHPRGIKVRLESGEVGRVKVVY